MSWSPIDASELQDGTQPDLGKYRIKYTITDADGNQVVKYREVLVRDTITPTISLIGDATVTVDEDTSYTDPGVIWSDNDPDASLTTNTGGFNINNPGTYTHTYTASDRSGNSASVNRTVTVRDKTAPTITLIGDNPINLENGATFNDPGATWTDNVDGTGTVSAFSGSVNTSAEGTYTLSYKKTDAAGNTSSTITRTVNVAAVPAPASHMNVVCSGYQAYNSSQDVYRDDAVPVYLKEIVLRPGATHDVNSQFISSSRKFGLRELTARRLGLSGAVQNLAVFDSTGSIAPWNLGSTSGANLGTEVDVNDKFYYRVSAAFNGASTVSLVSRIEKNPIDNGATDIFYGYFGPHIFNSDAGWSTAHFSKSLDNYEFDLSLEGSNPTAVSITPVTTALINQWKSVINGSSSDLTSWSGTINTVYEGVPYNKYNTYRSAYIDDNLQDGDYLVLLWYHHTGSLNHDVSSKLSTCPETDQPIHESIGRPLFYDTSDNLDTSEQNFSATWYNSKIPSFFFEHSYSSAPGWNFSDPTPGTPNNSQRWNLRTKNSNYAIYQQEGTSGEKLYIIKGANGFDYVYGKYGLYKFTGWKKKDGSAASAQYIYADMVVESPDSSNHPYGSLVAGATSHVRFVWSAAYSTTTPP